MLTFNLYSYHEKLSFHFKSSNLSFQNFEHQFWIFTELPVKTCKQDHPKFNQSWNLSFQIWAIWWRITNGLKITRTTSPVPHSLYTHFIYFSQYNWCSMVRKMLKNFVFLYIWWSKVPSLLSTLIVLIKLIRIIYYRTIGNTLLFLYFDSRIYR